MDVETIERPKYKSFRKKYNKIRHQFKKVFEENTALHEEEQKNIKTARRLQEENDALLDILLDVNDSKRVPSYLKYSIDDVPSESDVPELENDTEAQRASAEKMLEEARQGLENGTHLQHDYDMLVNLLKGSVRKTMKPQSLKKLERTVSHTTTDLLLRAQFPEDILDEEFSTYLDAAHEDMYLAALDASMDGLPPTNDVPGGKTVLSETTMKNPVSVYNWLRKHKPEVFIQEAGAEKEKPEEKESKAAHPTPAAIKRESRNVKRPSVAELLDDEGNLIGGLVDAPAASSKSKRKRDDDAYRPKGGGAASKRRKKSSGKPDEVD